MVKQLDFLLLALDQLVNTTGLLSAMRGRSMEELSDQHLLWTYDKVGAMYGRPSQIAPAPSGQGIKYYYVLPDGTEVSFLFIGGKVIRAQQVK